MIIPVPNTVLAIQTGTDEVLVTWGSTVQRVSIDRRVNSGSWVTVNNSFDYIWNPDGSFKGDGYTDTDVSDGDVLEYRIRAVVGNVQSSASTASTPITVDDSNLPLARDDFESYTNNTLLSSQTDWTLASTASGLTIGTRSGATTKTCRPGATANSACFWNADTFNANQRCEVDIGFVGNNGDLEIIGAAVRIQNGADTWYDLVLETVFDTTTLLLLRKVIAGTATVIQTTTTPIVAGDSIAIEVTGTGASTRLRAQKDIGAGWVDIWTNQDPGSTYINSGQAGMSELTLFGGSPAFNGITVEEWRGYNL